MTKAEIVAAVSRRTGVEKASVTASVEGFMSEIIDAMSNGENVYLRGFGSFVVKKRAAKAARHIKNETTILIPERHVATFKPASFFAENLRNNLKA